MAPRETENNAYAKFWGDKERALWHVVWSGQLACARSHRLRACFLGQIMNAADINRTRMNKLRII